MCDVEVQQEGGQPLSLLLLTSWNVPKQRAGKKEKAFRWREERKGNELRMGQSVPSFSEETAWEGRGSVKSWEGDRKGKKK